MHEDPSLSPVDEDTRYQDSPIERCYTCRRHPCMCEELAIFGEDMWQQPENPAPVREAEDAPSPWYVQDLLPRGQNVICFGRPGGGKTRVSVEMLAAVVTGTPALGHFDTHGPVRVLWLNADMPSMEAHNLYANTFALHDATLEQVASVTYVDATFAMDSAAGAKAFADLVSEHRPDIVLLDSQAELMRGDATKLMDSKQYWASIKNAQRVRPFTSITLAHTRKDGQPYGSIHHSAATDVVWLLNKMPPTTDEGAPVHQMRCLKTRTSKVVRGFDFTITPEGQVVWLCNATDDLEPEEAERVVSVMAYAHQADARHEVVDIGTFVKNHKDAMSDRKAREAFQTAVKAGWLRLHPKRGPAGRMEFSVTERGRVWYANRQRQNSDVTE